MTTTHARIPLVAVLVALGVAAPDAAMAKKTSHNYAAALTMATVATGRGYPAPGGRTLLVGSAKTKALGEGAIIDHITITGQPASNVVRFKGTEWDYFRAGHAHTKFTGISTVKPDGSQEVSVIGTVDRGSGRLRGATGFYTFYGTVPAGSNVMTGHSSGSIFY